MIRLRKAPRFETLAKLAERYPQLDPASLHTALQAIVLSAEIESGLDKHFEHYGLSHGRFVVLVNLYAAPKHELLPSAIADIVRVTRATMTTLLQRLEREGLIERRERPQVDRRTSPVRLTPKGCRLLERILPDHYSRISRMMRHLSRKEQNTLIRLMEKVREGIHELHASGGQEK